MLPSMELLAKLPVAVSTESEPLAAIERKDYRGAVALLMRHHGTEVYRFCLGLLGDADAAQDLLQSVFIQAFQALPTYVPRSTLRAWLYGIARHRCLDALKGSRRWTRLVEATGELPEAADSAPGSDARLAAADLRAALESCLDQIPAKARECLIMRYRSQLSYEEIASVCEEQIGTLRARVARALPLLRKCLEQKEALP
jgi:RNA polymerase sigma factor (sigma-70 family)